MKDMLLELLEILADLRNLPVEVLQLRVDSVVLHEVPE